MSSTSSPCAACKFLRRKCTNECVFAPYFPPDHPQKFANVHKVFGASNITKLLNELEVSQREEAVHSLAYEAEYRLRDPVYGCVGLISTMQHRLSQIKYEIIVAKKELAKYIGPSAMLPVFQHPSYNMNNPSSSAAVMPYNNNMGMGMGMGMQQGMMPMGMPMRGGGGGGGGGDQLAICNGEQQQMHQHQQQQQQQMIAARQYAVIMASKDQEEMMSRGYEIQRQNDYVGFDTGFDGAAGTVTAAGFNQMNEAPPPEAAATAAEGGGEILLPSLALGGSSYDYSYQIQEHEQQQQQQCHQMHGEDLSLDHHQQQQHHHLLQLQPPQQNCSHEHHQQLLQQESIEHLLQQQQKQTSYHNQPNGDTSEGVDDSRCRRDI